MDKCDLIWSICLADGLKAFGDATKIEFLVLLHKWIYNIYLMACSKLRHNGGTHTGALVIVAEDGSDGNTPGGQLIDDGDIEIAIDCHG